MSQLTIKKVDEISNGPSTANLSPVYNNRSKFLKQHPSDLTLKIINLTEEQSQNA